MKVKKIQLLGSCLVIGLALALTMAVSACSSSSPAATTTTSVSPSSNTTTAINTSVTTTTTKTSSKTTTTGKVSATLTSIAISPANPPNLKVSFTQNFTATGTYSDGSTADVSSLVTWNSSDPTIAAFTQPHGGLLLAMSLGTATISVTYQGLTSNSVNITIIPMPF